MKFRVLLVILIFFTLVFLNFNSTSVEEDQEENPQNVIMESHSVSRGANEPIVFTNRSPELDIPSITGDSFAWGDYNNDGYLDFIMRGNATWGTRLFKNNGPSNYNFTDVTNISNISGRGYPIWADYNNDGYLDFFAAGNPDSLWMNNGPPGWNFTDVTETAGGLDDQRPTEAAGWADYDRDGYVDLYVNSWYSGSNYYWDVLWHNNGNGTFTDVSVAAGVNTVTTPAYRSPPFAGMAVAWGDYNNDGWLDLYVGKYHITPNSLFRNNRDGTFTDVAVEVNVTGDPDMYQGAGPYYGHTAGVGFADFDNNGFMDIWVSNLAHKDSEESGGLGRGYFCDDAQLFYNYGPPDFKFADIRPSTGIPIIPVGTVVGNQWKDEDYFGITWGDVDNDGDQDMWLPNVKTYHSWDHSYLWRNNLNGTFTDITPTAGAEVWSNTGGALADYNNDGFLDLITEGTYPYEGKREIHLFENGKNDNNWIQFKLNGTVSNTAAIGARVNLTTSSGFQLREIGGDAGGHGFQNSFIVEYGLGDETSVISVEIRWPSGFVQVIDNPAINQLHNITEPSLAPSITSISVSENYVDENDDVIFDATTSFPTGSISLYEWDFDCDSVYDWNSTSTPLATFNFSRTGIYYATLRVWDSTGKIGITGTSEYITVNNVDPIAYAGEDQNVEEDEVVVFNASGSVDTYSDRQILEYYWDFDDDTNSSWSKNNVTVNHTYTDRGVYYVTLGVRDDDGIMSFDQVKVTVIDPPPVCDAGNNQIVYEDEVIYLNGTGNDTPSDIPFLYYRWQFGDEVQTEWSKYSNTTYVYTTQGNYTAILEVMDDHGLKGLDYVEIIVVSRHPNCTVEYTNQSVYEDQVVYFNGTGIDTPSDNETLSYYWDYGDENNSGWLEYYLGPNTNHVYSDQGVYTATFIVKDNDGLTRAAEVEITVTNLAPTVNISKPKTVDEDEPVYLTGEGIDTVSDMDGLAYNWDFGNGNESSTWSSTPEASTRYTEQGEYTATLTVKDDNNATGSETVLITVNNAEPVAKLKASKTTINEDESIQFDAGMSTDTESDTDSLEFVWQFEDDDFTEHPTPTSLINHTFTSSGSWEVKLTVIDDDEAKDTITLSVTVNNVAPIAKLHIERENWKINEEIVITTNGTWDTPSDLVDLYYKWNFGDGSPSTDYSGEDTVTYTYTKTGEFKITLTVMDDFGAKDTDSIVVTIEGVADKSEDEEAGMDYLLIIIGILVLIILIVLFFIFKRKIDKEHGDKLDLEEETLEEDYEVLPPPPVMIPGLPPLQPISKSAPTPQTDEALRFEAAVLSQSTLEKVEALGKKGINVSQPLGTLELVRAALDGKDYRSAFDLAKLAQTEAQALPQTPPVPGPKVKPLPSKVPLSPKPKAKKPPQPKIKKLGILDKVIPSLRKEELKKREEEEARLKEMEAEELEPEPEDEGVLDEDFVLEYDIDPEMSERISQLKSNFIKPIQEGMNTIEERLAHAQEMLRRVQDLDQVREAEAQEKLEEEAEMEDESEGPEDEETDETEGLEPEYDDED
jgi:PKD repeat protein